MNRDCRVNRETLRRGFNSWGVRAITTSAALVLFGCASTANAPTTLPQSVDLPAGHGAVVGTILLAVPTGPSGSEDQEIIKSLNAKRYEAIIGRFVFHDYGFASMTEHPGDKYRVSFAVGAETPFVIRAPAGTYSFQKISSLVSTVFGEQPGGCRIEGVANLNIHEGKVTYVGRLSILAEFKPDRGRRMIQTLRNLGLISIEHTEAALDVRVSALDMGEDGLRELGMNKSGPGLQVDTELMFVDQNKGWNCEQSPPPPPPASPQNR